MISRSAAIVGAAESADIGVVPDLSAMGLAVNAAERALADAGLKASDVDGIAAAGLQPYLATRIAHSLGVEAAWVDGTMIGGCSNIVQIAHAADAIETGRCEVVLIAHGESGRSGIGRPMFQHSPDSWAGQFEMPFGAAGPMTLLSLGTLRFLKDRGLERSALAEQVVAQRKWAAMNPRAFRSKPITVEEVLEARAIAYPLTSPMCCVVTDAGGAIVLTSAERAKDLPRPPVYVCGTGESSGSALASQVKDLTSSDAFVRSGAEAFSSAGMNPSEIDHAMLYDAIVTLPLMALEDLGLVPRGESGAFVAEGHTAPNGSLPVNTSGGGMNYTHSGMYGIYAALESIRQLRGEAAAQVDGLTTSITHAIGGMFQGAATVILSNEAG